MTKQEAVEKVLERYKHLNIVNMINNTYVPVGTKISIKHLINHYLGAVGNATGIERNGCGTQFYVHTDGTIVQATDINAYTYHIGAKHYKHPTARNANSVGVEMCCYCDGDRTQAGNDWWFTEATMIATAALDVYLMNKYGISPNRLLRHYDVTGKCCPAPFVHNNQHRGTWTWVFFKSVVEAVLLIVKNGKLPEEKEEELVCCGCSTTKAGLVTTADLNIRTSPTGSVVKTAPKGTALYPMERTTPMKDGYCWFKNKDGWFYSRYVTGWIKDEGQNKWWYIDSGVTTPGSTWKQINGVWYYFDAGGYMATGWRHINGIWYYLDASGAMITGWKYIDGKWYYFNPSGAMVTYQYVKAKDKNIFYWINSEGVYEYEHKIDLSHYKVEEER